MALKSNTPVAEPVAPGDVPTLTCGLVMPISACDGVPAEHWVEVKLLIQDAVESISSPKFNCRLVSDADDVGVIQKRIVHGIYNADMIVCDVSGRNANVMFELGMRLAFDKPTIIIKDDKTEYSFDTSIIEHIPYPRDLRFSKIVSFKKQLAEKVLATYQAAQVDPEHSTFLKNFGTFKVAKLAQTTGSSEQVIIEMLQEMQGDIARIRRSASARARPLEIATGREREREGRTKIIDELFRRRSEGKLTEPFEEIARDLEKKLPAPSYFPGPDEFRAALKDLYELAAS